MRILHWDSRPAIYFSIAAINPGAIVNSPYEMPKLLVESNSACRPSFEGSTPAGTYTVAVIAAAGTTQVTDNVSLVIQ